MDGVSAFELWIFLPATFAAALVAGLAGFAFGLNAAATWLHVLSPSDTAALIVGFGLVVPGVAVWKLRRALDPRRLWPFLVVGALGIPVGVAVLERAQPGRLRVGIGVLLVAYSLYALVRPAQLDRQGPIRTCPRRTLAAATYALQLFVERLVEFFLFLLSGRLLIWLPLTWRHFSCFWLAVAHWSLI